MRRCTRCGDPLWGDLIKCRGCGAWNAGSEALDAPRLVRLGSAEVAPVERVRSGPWDKSLGGGLVRTGAYLIGGAPGAGKTTLCLMACDSIAYDSDAPPLYIAAEQSLGEIRTNAERMGLACLDAFLMFEAMSYKASPEIGEILSAMIRDVRPCAVIVDSLPEFTGHNEGLAGRLLKSLKLDAVATRCPILVLAHVTKDLDIGGLMTHQHTVDAVGVIEVDAKSERRTLRWKKNRFGSTRTRFVFDVTDEGIAEVTDPDQAPEAVRART